MKTETPVPKDKIKMLFDPLVARSVGTDAAIILQNIEYWVTRKEEEASDSNFHDGHYWTYNSSRRFAEIFDWMHERKIARCLQKLEDKKLLISGNYNKHKYDRTKWYSLKCNHEDCTLCQRISQERPMDLPSVSDANDNSVEPIPDSKHRVSNPITNHYSGLEQTSINKDNDVTDFLSRGSERSSVSERSNGAGRNVKDGRMSKRLAEQAQSRRKLYAEVHGFNTYFFEAWEKKFGKAYPWPDDYENDDMWEALEDLVSERCEEFQPLVNLYFLQDFRKKTNYRIHHFLSERIQNNLQTKIITSTIKNEHREIIYQK